jgi:chaperonin GroEL
MTPTSRSASRSSRRPLKLPLKQLAENAGYEGNIVVEKVKELGNNMGFDVVKGEYVDMMKAGIIDPTKVIRSAVLNAVSVAGLFLTTGALVVTKEIGEDKVPAPMPEY